MNGSTHDTTTNVSESSSGNARVWLATAAILASCFSFDSVAFADTPANYELKIQPRPLGAALQELAKQSGVQIVFMSRIAEGHDAPALNGRYTPEAALTTLLNGTDLTFHRLNNRTIAVEPKAVVRKASDTTSSNSSLQPVSDSSVPRSVQAPLRLAQGARGPSTSADAATADRRSVAASTDSDSAPMREVVVTGSRIRRAVEDMPAPTTVVDAAAIAQTGLDNLADIMTRASQFGVGLGNNPGGDGANSADAGATFLNLRGMGTNRTLVLINGLRRVSGTAASSAVDLSTIPAAMIDHVEVTTGGAAAVYGADAVTGVVNVILKRPTEGIDVAVRGGTSTRGDDKRLALSAVLGQKTERTEFSLGLSYSYEPLLHAKQRSFSRYNVSEFSNPNVTAANPYTNLRYVNWRFPGTSYGSAFVIGNTAYTIGETGALRPVHNDSTPYGPLGYLGIGGDGFDEADFDVLRLQSKIFSSLANFTYHFSDTLAFTTDLQLGHSSTAIPLQPNYEYSSIDRNNPFVPAAVAALMDQYGLTQLAYGRTDVDQGISVNRGDRSTYTLVTKLDGDLGSAFKWDVAYQYGHFQGKSTLTHNRITSRYNQALNAVAGPSGPICADPVAVAAGCEPINIFGPNAATADAVAYFRDDGVTDISNSQQVIGAHLNGSLVSLPAGPFKVAAGVEQRRETQSVQTDPLGSQRLLQVNNGPSSYAGFDVKEAFAEIVVPLLTDVPLARTLEIEAAARYSDYDTIGSTTAWKFGGIWAPIADVRFRFTRSADVRAPNLTELFSPGQNGLTNPYDPCSTTYINAGSSTRAANCAALGIPVGYVDGRPGDGKTLTTRGNPDLVPEESKDWTAGVVFMPRVIPRLKLSVDWWSIDIDHAVTNFNAQQVVNGCVDAQTINNPQCSLVLRGGTVGGAAVPRTQLSGVIVEPINAANLKGKGIDFAAQYNVGLPTHLFNDSNVLFMALDGAYYMENTTYVPQSPAVHTAGNSSLPKFRTNLSMELVAGRLSLDWNARFISKSKENVDNLPLFVDDNHVASRFYNDIGGSFDVNDTLRLKVGINNVFDVIPPGNAYTFEGIGRGALFDNVGRYLFVEARARL
ncbi:MAG: TonB-dependent receptor [Gammaproteobacteria bacterium]